MKKVYQDDTNLLKVHNEKSFANLHTCPKLGLLHTLCLRLFVFDDLGALGLFVFIEF